MIQIAICDDEPEILSCIEKQISEYGIQKKIVLSINTFQYAKDLETAVLNQTDYQIFILDILMPQMNGIELGQIIRNADEQAVIICLTSSKDFAYQAFGIYAQRYLLKPPDKNSLYEAMDFAVSSLQQRNQILYVNTADGIQKIFYHEIEYIENLSRTLHIFTIDNREIISRYLRISFEQSLNELLENKYFIQVHKSFIVNLSQIRVYDLTQMTMLSGKQIPISKSRQPIVKRNYLKYTAESY